MERNSIYVDSYFISSYISHYYCRYVDDNSSLGPDRSYVQQVCYMISEQDPRGKIKWEIGFPRDNVFVPFLDTEVKITPEGELKTRYFRKPQDKGIIVNAKSHHPCDIKKEVLKNFYKNSYRSLTEELQHSLNIVDELAVKNGSEPRRNYPSA